MSEERTRADRGGGARRRQAVRAPPKSASAIRQSRRSSSRSRRLSSTGRRSRGSRRRSTSRSRARLRPGVGESPRLSSCRRTRRSRRSRESLRNVFNALPNGFAVVLSSTASTCRTCSAFTTLDPAAARSVTSTPARWPAAESFRRSPSCSHEILELLGDPYCVTWTDAPADEGGSASASAPSSV